MKVIAITGGPCAGKTSAMGALREKLGSAEISASFIPEAATDLIQSGIAPWTCASMLEFQTRVIALQLERENEARDLAASSNVDVVICDRGLCDSHAYLSDDEYADALAANGIDHAGALARYDAVFHLESIAKDNPGAYTKANNSARFEDADDAARVDERVKDAWSDHPVLHVVGNHADFTGKADELFGLIAQFLANSSDDCRKTSEPVLISACLLGEPCRYDGKAQPCEAVIEMAKARAVVPVCPEVIGGLPTPRSPSEIQADGRVVDMEGIDRTAAFEAGAREALRIAREHGCKRAILKENSPSCGLNRIYDGSFSGTRIPGKGKTAALLIAAGIEVLSDADALQQEQAKHGKTERILP